MVTRTVIRIAPSEAAAAADITTSSLAAVDSDINSPNDQINKISPQKEQSKLCNHHPSCTKRAQHPSPLCWQHGAKESICSFLGCHNKGILLGLCADHGGLVQLCRHKGCINVVDLERRGGLCYIHQIGPMDGEESDSDDSEGEIRLCSFRGCISNATTDEGLCDMHSAHDNNYCFTDVGKKRALPLGDSICDKDVKKRQKMKMNAFTIDLSDVPPQSPIPKRKCYMKEGASKYTGVSFFQQRNEWAAQIMIESKRYIIGYYESEEEAAVDYARALFKYKGGVYQQSFEVDLTDVPPQPPILKREGRIKDGTSKYLGVSFDITNNKWQTHINIGGKKRRIGVYENEEQAAVDYARAVFKYKEKKKENCQIANVFINLSDVPPQSPIPKSSGCIKDGASKYTGVYSDKQTNKWQARITIEGKVLMIGYYENEEDAAVDYARAVFKYKGQEALEKAREQHSFIIGLSDVPTQSPIPKSFGYIKDGASKYKGVCFNRKSNKWQAEVNIEGKSRFIGSYDDEEEAAVDYARAVFKYKGQGALDKAMEFIIDLSDISPQLPIPKSSGRIREGASKYTGVSFNKQKKKWKAEITVKGKQRLIGSYDDEEEAAVDYARAVFKYKGPVLQTT